MVEHGELVPRVMVMFIDSLLITGVMLVQWGNEAVIILDVLALHLHLPIRKLGWLDQDMTSIIVI